MERRSFFSCVAAMLGFAGVAKAKAIVADPSVSIGVITLGEEYGDELNEGQIAQIRAKWEAMNTGLKCVVVPYSVDIKIIPATGVYHRERLGEYEIEIVAKTEEELLARRNDKDK